MAKHGAFFLLIGPERSDINELNSLLSTPLAEFDSD
jgi:hypothetical protein